LGFVPLTDCAPLVMAVELGLFRRHGLRVRLSRELGWASVRDKIVHRELDATHALAAMPVVATIGMGCAPCECVTGLVLNLHGNAITLSDALWRRRVRDKESLRGEIVRVRKARILTFGVVSPFSSHNFLLRAWFSSAGIDPDRDVRIVVVPPPLMVPNLKAGHLDGFCVGEPWNSVAARTRTGWCIATSSELDPGHPEKVLMVRRDFADERSEEHVALIAALLQACEFCSQPGNRGQVAAILAQRHYLNVPEACVVAGLNGRFEFGAGNSRSVGDFMLFYGEDVNAPDTLKGSRVMRQLRESNLCKDPSRLDSTLRGRAFRLDMFDQAHRLLRAINNDPCQTDELSPSLVSSP
jgi:ABC-type nitrate/sulfonate/bicarbonate transport system substrate-binding protein